MQLSLMVTPSLMKIFGHLIMIRDRSINIGKNNTREIIFSIIRGGAKFGKI